jgi:hypothetical protein
MCAAFGVCREGDSAPDASGQTGLPEGLAQREL